MPEPDHALAAAILADPDDGPRWLALAAWLRDELSYRQVLAFVRRASAHKGLAAAALPALEAEVARRFPPAAHVLAGI